MTPLQQYLNRFTTPPEEWFEETVKKGKKSEPNHRITVQPLGCTTFKKLVENWRDTRNESGGGKKGALRWNDRYDIGLSTMLAVAASTDLPTSQVWLRVIAVAGSGKSTLCEAIAASEQWSYATSVFTGVHSGFTLNGEDNSLIPLINHKTFLINEGDTLMKQPNKEQLMSELRDLHFGVARNRYRTGLSQVYDNIRTTIILAGTPAIRVLNASALGDRFLDLVTYEKESNLEESLLVRNVIGMGIEAIQKFANVNGSPKKYLSTEKLLAYQYTAGYLDYLRNNIIRLVGSLSIPTWYVPACEELGKLVAIMRTRSGKGEEDPTEPELHTRLGEQISKLGLCLAVVLNRPIDNEVMRRLATVSLDTCYGNTYKVCYALAEEQRDKVGLSLRLKMDSSHVTKALSVLHSIDAIRYDSSTAASGARNRNRSTWRLSVTTGTLLNKLNKWLNNA